jgi:hypothetical protein
MVEVLKNQQRWPMAVLPLKRVREDGSCETAFMVPDYTPVIYYGNVWDPKASALLATYRSKRYGDFGGIIRAGWRID